MIQAVGGAITLAGCLGSDDDTPTSANDSNASDDDDSTSANDSNASDGMRPVDGAWRTFQGDSANTGTGRETATGPAETPAVEWTLTTGDELGGDPVIVDDTVLAGSWDAKLYAASLSSGDELWSYETDDAVLVPVAVASGVVFVGNHTTVAALDIESGTPYWTTSIDGRVRGGPAVADGTLYVPTTDQLLALSATDGTRQWHVRTGGPVESTPRVTDDSVYFTSLDGNVYAVGTDGELRWQEFISTRGGVPSPTVVDGVVYLGWGDGKLYAFDAADGTELWTDRTGGAETIAVSDGVAYVATYPLKAIDTDARDYRWTVDEPPERPNSFTAGTERVYLGTREGKVFAYDRDTGREQWQYQGNYAVQTSVAIADGRLVYGDEFGNLVALA